MAESTRITLIEDNPEYRRVIKMALDRAADMELIAKFGSAEQALRSLEMDSSANATDIILLDLNLPKMSGLEALPWLRKYAPAARVIVLTQSEDKQDVLDAVRDGAAGYLLKSSTVTQIQTSIRDAMNGGAPLDSSVTQHVLASLQQRLPEKGDHPELSGREAEVLALLGEGLVKKEIAQKLEISSHTVATHVRHIYEKLDVLNAPSAISKAYQLGLLPNEKS